jgi:uncharacterized membrane protein YraQ (UPF0718 family)
MKYALLTIGIILLILGFVQTGRYILNYDTLTQYGKGYVWGSVLLMIIGGALIYFSTKRNSNIPSE